MIDISVKQRTLFGVLWSSIERFSLQGIQFVIGIVMARFLIPSDYGMIGMLAIFLALSQAFIDSGFSNALIQKQSRTELDYSTVFFFNIVVSVFFYILLFLFAPVISDFYELKELTLMVRVIGLNLILSSLCAIHRTKLIIELDFKTQAKVSLSSAVISGVVGVLLAMGGYGVWALVIQSLLNTLLNTVFLYYCLQWRPLLSFSKQSFNSLFSFGSKLLVAGLISTIYNNLYSLVIGKKFNADALGFYTRAEQVVRFPSSNIASILSRVTFPVLSTIQDDNLKLKELYCRYLRVTCFVVFPLMIGLAVLSEPLIKCLLTDRWIGSIVLLQILCFDWMWDPICSINLNLLYVKGRSDLVLKLEFVKKIIAISILVVTIPFGIITMCFGRVLYSLIAVGLNTYYTGGLIQMGIAKQLRYMLPSLLASLTMGGVVLYSVSFICVSNLLQLAIGCFIGFIYYLSISILFKLAPLKDIRQVLKTKS